tara:strand:- start:751 stop:1356 length:606 start_codon:yes stop_codon:yes gene_type:complete
MRELQSVSNLVVTQCKEWGEILTYFETKNKYIVRSESGAELYWAAEEGGSIILRWLLKAFRPFTVVLINADKKVLIRIKRPFRFYFHQATVFDASGESLGRLNKRFSIIREKYSVFDRTNNEIYQLFGPLFRPWTFVIKNDGEEFGKITKNWSGLLKESFTDADNFSVEFPAIWDVKLKALFLGSVFLIDFVHFEDKKNKG